MTPIYYKYRYRAFFVCDDKETDIAKCSGKEDAGKEEAGTAKCSGKEEAGKEEADTAKSSGKEEAGESE